MSERLQGEPPRGIRLLELYDARDLLDEQIRIRRTILLLTPLVSTVLAAPLLAVLFVNEVRFFAAYPIAFLVLLGAILYAVTGERRRLENEREAIRDRIRRMEVAPQRRTHDRRAEGPVDAIEE